MIFGGFRPIKPVVEREALDDGRKFSSRVYVAILEQEKSENRDLLEVSLEENHFTRKKSERLLEETSEEENELNFEELLKREKTAQRK